MLQDDPLWYKDAVIYQLHVRCFFDENGDGVGDFAGLTAKLDYVQELGVTAIWLLPFIRHPSKTTAMTLRITPACTRTTAQWTTSAPSWIPLMSGG